MSKDERTLIIDKESILKFDAYCQTKYGKSFDDTVNEKIAEILKTFIEEVKDGIKRIEKL